MLFSELNLAAPILKALEEKGYTTPTPIQAQAIPLVKQKIDVMGLAQTGTGKTAGFVLPMLDMLAGCRARARMPRALILEPTRELALQVAENLTLYGKHLKLTHALIYGGASLPDQQKQIMNGVDILIATPGRLLDLFQRGGLLMTDIQFVVLDEADRMLDMGFIPDVEKILSLTPAKRQTLMFSATMAPEIEAIKNRFMRDPQLVQVARTSESASTITQNLILCSNDRAKEKEALRLMSQPDVVSAFVFCNRKKDIGPLAKILAASGLKAAGLHGDMVQSARTQTLNDFREGKISILVCSDVAARGLDVKGVSHVVNFDVPMNAEDYVHRIGRTGRAGMEGVAYTLATPDDAKYLDAIEKLAGVKFPERAAGETVQSDAGPAASEDAPKRGRGAHPTRDRGPKREARPERTERPERKPEAPKAETAEKAEAAPKPERAPRERKEREYKDEKKPRDWDEDGAPTGKGFGEDAPAFFKMFG